MNLNNKSVKTVIAKIVRDLNLGDKEIPWQDMIEWIIEGAQHIGAYNQYEERIGVEIQLENYSAKLPDDYYSMMANPGLKYRVERDTIIGDKSNGVIKINYLAIASDCDGFPMVPDDVSYDTALFWKVAYQLAIRDELPNKNLTIEYCQNRWNKYCGQARSIANTPTADEWDRIAQRWLKLKPDVHQYRKLFVDVDYSNKRRI